MVDFSEYDAWLDANEIDRLANVVDQVTSFHDSNRLLAPRIYVCVDDLENTNDGGIVWMELVPDPESDSPYYALLYDAPASDRRALFMLGSNDLRELAARLRAVVEVNPTETTIVTLESVDDGTWDSDVHPRIEVQKKPSINDQAVAHLWFEHVERFPYSHD